ncbi:MAG: methylmalonyl Co-A mutase-associated GTPase MeaB, partial [Proteobacteria bacterium]|nr:methylmalonyl Co-A mutase-associated GTPase MeaB [Pseudomonadota bacterium]
MAGAGDIIARLRSGEPLALARAITAVENETGDAAEILRAIQPHLGGARVHGFTGPPGVGKSTLVDAYITELRKRDLSVGVIAVDPSSPVSGGAILGDRVRMTSHGLDPEVFVRSIAARGHLGGLSATTAFVVDVMDAAGKDVIVIETVGTGQSEVEVAQIADTKVVICAPGAGDDVQAIKAGILEIGDLLVVNKADLPAAEVTAAYLRGML